MVTAISRPKAEGDELRTPCIIGFIQGPVISNFDHPLADFPREAIELPFITAMVHIQQPAVNEENWFRFIHADQTDAGNQFIIIAMQFRLYRCHIHKVPPFLQKRSAIKK